MARIPSVFGTFYASTPVSTNLALISTTTASVESSGFFTRVRMIDGSRNAQGSFASHGFQMNGNGNTLELDFGGNKTITRLDIIFAANLASIDSSTDPADTTVTSDLATIDFTWEYWNGSAYVAWVSVTGNDKQWRQSTVSQVTSKVRFTAVTVQGGAFYGLEIETWGY